MAFKVLFIAHAPDADKDKHRSSIQTDMYHLYTVVLKNQDEALEISKEFVDDAGIDCILLCPGFTNQDVAEISKTAGDKVAVAVARGDGPGSKITLGARKREGYPSRK
jgi:stage V sporulation protein SpoVS